MQAVTLSQHGDIHTLSIQERPTPSCRANEVLVRVQAAALNHLDLFVCRGWPGLKLALPHILGSDAAGTVEQIGKKVTTELKVGDAVVIQPALFCGSCEFCQCQQQALCVNLKILGENLPGVYCEYLSLPAENLKPLPQHLSIEEGAAFPLTFLTAWRMLTSLAHVKPGETLLIQGIGGGVATAALLLGVELGCRVLVTSRSQTKLDQACKHGATAGFLSNRESLVDAVRQLTKKRGVDVVVDCVGAATWRASLACLRHGGRLLTCGATTGPHPKTDINRIFSNQLKIFGSTMGSQDEFTTLHRFVCEKVMRPIIDRVFALDEIHAALTRLQAGEQMGKIVLRLPS